MSRFKLKVEYEGTRYSGWQMQKGGKSIQGEIMDACRELFENRTLDVYGAGRTDAGVHAIGQIAHLEVDTDLPPLRIKYRINDRLPPDICIIDVEQAAGNFHARHDAVARSYIYQVSRRRTAFGKKFVWWIKDPLSVERMNETAKEFVGLKDFRNFTDIEQEQGSTKTEIIHAEVKEFSDMILFHVIGSHFLWKQVRRMTGVLVETGRGKLSPGDVTSFFKGKTDIPAKLTAPPSGLFLDKVWYSRDEIVYDAKPLIRI
ncbi:MAG: tRNA pseudouridine(38-40) synthase TruA [Bacteroidales bacterium]